MRPGHPAARQACFHDLPKLAISFGRFAPPRPTATSRKNTVREDVPRLRQPHVFGPLRVEQHAQIVRERKRSAATVFRPPWLEPDLAGHAIDLVPLQRQDFVGDAPARDVGHRDDGPAPPRSEGRSPARSKIRTGDRFFRPNQPAVAFRARQTVRREFRLRQFGNECFLKSSQLTSREADSVEKRSSVKDEFSTRVMWCGPTEIAFWCDRRQAMRLVIKVIRGRRGGRLEARGPRRPRFVDT